MVKTPFSMRTVCKNALLLGVIALTLSAVACQSETVTPKAANLTVPDSLPPQTLDDDQPPKTGWPRES